MNLREECPHAPGEREVVNLTKHMKRTKQWLKNMPEEKDSNKAHQAVEQHRPTGCIERKCQLDERCSDDRNQQRGAKNKDTRAQNDPLLLFADGMKAAENVG